MRAALVLLAVVLFAAFVAAGDGGSGTADEDNDKDYAASSKTDDDLNDHDASNTDSGKDSDDYSKDSGGDYSKDSGGGYSKDTGDDYSNGDYHDPQGMKQRLESRGLHVEQRSTSSEDGCVDHSYGEVREYFQDHPCHAVTRAWYKVCDDDDNTAIVSVAWVEMPDSEDADALQELMDRHGSGNITELSRNDEPYGDVRYSGKYQESGRDNDTYFTVQAQPIGDSEGADEVAQRSVGATTSK